MNPSVFKERVVALLGDHVEFLGPSFDDIVGALTPGAEERIFAWVDGVVGRHGKMLHPKPRRRYKGYETHNLIVFRTDFSLEGAPYRILLVKVKNSWYIELEERDAPNAVRMYRVPYRQA